MARGGGFCRKYLFSYLYSSYQDDSIAVTSDTFE